MTVAVYTRNPTHKALSLLESSFSNYVVFLAFRNPAATQSYLFQECLENGC